MRLNRDALKAIRERSGLTKAELAAQSGLRLDTLSRIEGGVRPGTDAQFIAIAKALRVPVTAIVQED